MYTADKLDNIPSETVKEYYCFGKMEPCLFKKRGHVMNYACLYSNMIKIR